MNLDNVVQGQVILPALLRFVVVVVVTLVPAAAAAPKWVQLDTDT